MINVACAVIYHLGKVLIAQKANGPEEGKWEFPGGKCKENETVQQCAVREVREELVLEIKAGRVVFTNYIESIKHGRINLHFIECICEDPRTQLNEHSMIKWVEFNELDSKNFVSGDVPFVHWLCCKTK